MKKLILTVCAASFLASCGTSSSVSAHRHQADKLDRESKEAHDMNDFVRAERLRYKANDVRSMRSEDGNDPVLEAIFDLGGDLFNAVLGRE